MAANQAFYECICAVGFEGTNCQISKQVFMSFYGLLFQDLTNYFLRLGILSVKCGNRFPELLLRFDIAFPWHGIFHSKFMSKIWQKIIISKSCGKGIAVFKQTIDLTPLLLPLLDRLFLSLGISFPRLHTSFIKLICNGSTLEINPQKLSSLPLID